MNLNEVFSKYIRDWRVKLNADEWFFAKFIENVTSTLSSEESFQLIPEAIDLVLSQTDPYLLSVTLNLLESLIRISKTSELNNHLRFKLKELKLFTKNCGEDVKIKVMEIAKYYRIKM